MALPTATLTVLFTDLAGYTARVSRADRAGLHDILRDHEQAVMPVVERRGGRVVKNLGDSYLCLFAAATEALRAAFEIREAIQVDGTPVIRIAMCTGDVEEISGDAFGETVNRAARILAETPAGEIWFGEGTRACMNEAEVPWESVGAFHLKGIPGASPCYRAVPPDRAWLPEPVVRAVIERRLVRLQPEDSVPAMPPRPVVLLEGFAPDSEALASALAGLPALDPGDLHLVAYELAPGDRLAWTETGGGLVIAAPSALETALAEVITRGDAGSEEADRLAETMHIANLGGGNLELVLCGLALPAVPFSEIVASYTYDLLADGTWSTRGDRSLLRVEVRSDSVMIHALRRGISAAGRSLKAGESRSLAPGDTVETPCGPLRFQSLGPGYSGALLSSPRVRLAMTRGQTVEIGRSPNPPGLPFPSRPGATNIRWCTGQQANQARTNGFTLDRVLAGRRQASVHVGEEGIELKALHQSCPTYVLGVGGFRQVHETHHLEAGDHIVAGTTVVGLVVSGAEGPETVPQTLGAT